MTPAAQAEWVAWMLRKMDWVRDPSRPFPSARPLSDNEVDALCLDWEKRNHERAGK